jgi:antitoxin ParD1/3/4
MFDTICHIWYSENMPNRTTVNVSLTPELNAFLESRLETGRYQTTSEVVREALRLLQDQELRREQTLQSPPSKPGRAATQAAGARKRPRKKRAVKP